jgi:GT2 family glycosyltransferase
VGAKCIYINGTIQHAGVGFKKNGSPRHVYKNWPSDAPDVNLKKEFQAVTAACMLVRREAYYQVNGFDEIFKTGKEDVDFCLKVGQAGWKIIYEPKACIIHFEHKSPGRHDYDEYNRGIYLQRWSGKVREDISVIKALGNVVK